MAPARADEAGGARSEDQFEMAVSKTGYLIGAIAGLAIAGVALSGRTDYPSNGSSPQFLTALAAPVVPPGEIVTPVPAVSTWALIFLGILLAASSAASYKRAYRS